MSSGNKQADNWHDDSSGDMHYWSVWHEGKPFEGYYEVVPRFCSEFGFQSFPSLHTIRTFAPAEHENPTAPLLEHHQRHPRGNTIVTETIARYFRVPFTFGDFLYLSQVQQAMAIRMAVEYWRLFGDAASEHVCGRLVQGRQPLFLYNNARGLCR